MNIFEALSYGKGRINEENTSSFLAYLLKGDESHGLRYEFLERFLKKSCGIDIDVSDYSVSVELEKGFKHNEKEKCFIDILLTLEDDNKHKIIFGIENKITSKSCQTHQLKNEYIGIKNNLEKEYIGTKNNLKSDNEVFMIFVVPEEDSATKKEFDKLEDLDTKHKSIITWNDIVNIIKSMLADEFKCKISPLSDYVRQTLQAFCYYVNHWNDVKIKQSIKVIYGEKSYNLVQLENNHMRIKCNDGTDGKGLIPKHMIFDVLFALDENRTHYHTKWNGRDIKSIDGTPQSLGAEMFAILKKENITQIEITKTPNFSEDNKRTGSNEF